MPSLPRNRATVCPMSHSDTESHKCNSHDRDSTVPVTREEFEALKESHEQLQSEHEQLKEKHQQLKDDLQDTQEHAGKERAELSARVSEVENTVEEANINDENPTPEGPTTTIQHDELTPIEQLSQTDDIDEVTDSQSVRRAVSLFKNLSDWGSRTPKGIVLKPADNPLKLLEADQDESLCWKQYYRAAEALERLSEGSVTFFDSDRHGKMICLHEQSEAFDRVANGELTPSSVGAKG